MTSAAHRARGRRRLVTALAGAAVVLTACGGGAPSTGSTPGGASSEHTTTGTDAPTASGEPASPQARQDASSRAPTPSPPARLAQRLNRAERVLRTGDGGAAAARRAGVTQQRLARRVHEARPGPRRRVLAALDPGARATLRANLTARETLGQLTRPQPELPDWGIVEPPPPARLRGFYREAQQQTGIPWSYLAAIHLVESRMGRIDGTSTAGAQGPMQFIPGTWDIYGEGGDVTDPRDAILAAGRLLAANGGPQDMAAALYSYNQSGAYVDAVTAYAERMRTAPYTYRGYWAWQVYYRERRGTFLLPVGYPQEPAVRHAP